MVLVLLAGGTGGHVYPAIATYIEMSARGHSVHIVTDVRGNNLINEYSTVHQINFSVIQITSYGWTGGVFRRIKALCFFIKNIYDFFLIFYKLKPHIVWGFGSYVSLSGLLVSCIMRITNGLYQHDLVFTKTNRLSIHFTKYISIMHEDIKKDNYYVVGAVIRNEFILHVAKYAVKKNKILILGGSLGASIWNIIPEIIEGLDVEVVHQTDDVEYTLNEYRKYGFSEKNVYVTRMLFDIYKHIAEANIIFSRAGIVSIYEILLYRKFAFYLPIKKSVNDHQMKNAKWVESYHCGLVLTSFSHLREMIIEMMNTENVLEHNIRNLRFDGNIELSNLIENIFKYAIYNTDIGT